MDASRLAFRITAVAIVSGAIVGIAAGIASPSPLVLDYRDELAALQAADPDRGYAELHVVAAIEATSIDAWNALGQAAEARHDAETQRLAYEKAYWLARADPAAAGRYGRAIARVAWIQAGAGGKPDPGELALAARLLETALTAHPDAGELHHALGLAYLLAGDPARSAAELEAAIALAPDPEATREALRRVGALP